MCVFFFFKQKTAYEIQYGLRGLGDVYKRQDILGVLYINIDDGGGWRYNLLKEMKAAGLEIDLNNI